MTPPDGGINAADIYSQIARVGAKLDVLITKMDGASAQISDHEARIRAIERARWPIASVTVLCALGSLVVAILVALYGR